MTTSEGGPIQRSRGTLLGIPVSALAALFYRSRVRRGLGPFWLGLVAAGIVLVAKFALALDPATYVGVGLLLAAGVWNVWPRPDDGCELEMRRDPL